MADKNVDQIKALYTEIAKIAPSQDWDKVLKLSKKILGYSIYETKAFQCKIVCLIQLDKFDEALTSIERSTEVGILHFEKAYCEYRMNKNIESYTTLKSCKEMGIKEKELLAQVTYRMEKYNESYEAYRDIVKDIDDDFDNERQSNLSAVVASWQTASPSSSKDLDMSSQEDKTYELCYNSACISVAKGNYSEAIEKLDKAEAMCKEFFAEEASEDQDQEMAIIRVQKAYCLQKQGDDEQSLKMYNNALKNKPSDLGVMGVASNNLLCLNKDQNVFDSKKRIKVATALEMEQKLNSMQRRIIGYNEVLFAIVTNQKDVARKLLDKYLGNFNDRELYSLLEMAQLCKEKKYAEAEKLLKDCLKTTSTTSKKIQYYLIQVLLCQGKTGEAIIQFKNLEEFKTFKLGIISSIVTLLKKQNNNKDEITKLLSNAIDYFSKTNVNATELQTYIKENAQFQIDSGDLQKACEMLEKLRAIRPKDFKILSKLINLYSKFDAEKANKLSKDLPTLEDISAAGSDIDMDLLESQFSLLSSKYSKQLKTLGQLKSPDLKSKSDKVKTVTTGDDKLKKKKKKIRLPKNFDPKVQVDAERWVPLKERSYYRGKRNKKKGGAIGKGTQGAVGGKEMPQSPRAVAEVDSVKLPDKLKPKPASAAANLKKKKKGGSKW